MEVVLLLPPCMNTHHQGASSMIDQGLDLTHPRVLDLRTEEKVEGEIHTIGVDPR